VIFAFGNPVYDEITTPRVSTDGRVLSGCSTNFALALSRLGEQVTLVGTIGRDYRTAFERDLHRAGIAAVVTEAPETGGFRLNYYDDRGNRTLDVLGRAAAIEAIPAGVEAARAVLVGPILGETGFDFIRRLRQATQGVFMLDPQGLLRRETGGAIEHVKTRGIEEIVGCFDIVKPNELECKVLTGIDPRKDAETPARMIHAWGPRIVVITLAEEGSVVFDGHTFTRVGAYPADCVDATGAGDTYAAGFLYARLKGHAPETCALWGTATASIMIEHVGPDFPMTRESVQERVNQLAAAQGVAASRL
jgi:sugar/nucleoside kinase (ribokinase family)